MHFSNCTIEGRRYYCECGLYIAFQEIEMIVRIAHMLMQQLMLVHRDNYIRHCLMHFHLLVGTHRTIACLSILLHLQLGY